MAPGCFSGVAALFLLVPIVGAMVQGMPLGQSVPWPIVFADMFGFASAASVVAMYKHRHRFMAWKVHRQRAFAMSVWGVHVVAFALVVAALGYWY